MTSAIVSFSYRPIVRRRMSGYLRRINESFLMYAMRIEDADHVTGNHVIWLQNIRASASAADAADDQERLIYRRCLNANERPSTLTTDCILWECGSGMGPMERWIGEKEAGNGGGTAADRKRFVLVNGWSVWLASGMKRERLWIKRSAIW